MVYSAVIETLTVMPATCGGQRGGFIHAADQTPETQSETLPFLFI
jgi:hypothetical protein